MRNRFLVLDCWISSTNMAEAVAAVAARAQSEQGGYVCFSNVHAVVSSRRDASLRDATNESFMSMPDGKPVALLGRMLGSEEVSQVAGPDFMMELMQAMPTSRHYLFGATPLTLQALTAALQSKIRGLNIVGQYAPPFRAMTDSEEAAVLEQIAAAKPDYIWVGLGAPKQERWMARHWQVLAPAVLLGVGAAFDFHAGVKRRAPVWVRRFGLEWLHRLVSEPRRLWRRYLTTNSVFLVWAIRVLCRRWVLRGGQSQ